MEEKIYDRQVTKESTALRVIDDKQIDRHFSNADLQDILKYTRPDLSEANTKERPQVCSAHANNYPSCANMRACSHTHLHAHTHSQCTHTHWCMHVRTHVHTHSHA